MSMLNKQYLTLNCKKCFRKLSKQSENNQDLYKATSITYFAAVN